MRKPITGLLGFSPVVTATALGITFYQPGWRAMVCTAPATMFSVVVPSAMDIVSMPFANLALTAPFVLVPCCSHGNALVRIRPPRPIRRHPQDPSSAFSEG